MEFDFRGVDFFKSNNKLSGSIGDFRYMMIPDGEEIALYTYEKYCFEVAETMAETRVAMNEEGLAAAGEWLNRQYDEYQASRR